MQPGGSPQVPQKRSVQTPSAPSKLQKNGDSRQSTPRAARPRRTSLDDAASSPSYISAICDVLDEHPDGLGKDWIIRQVLERHLGLWPNRTVDTVKRGLGVAFSIEPKSKVPRIWEWESMDSAGTRMKTWKNSAPQDHQYDHDLPTNDMSTILYVPPYTSPEQSIALRAGLDQSISILPAASEILSNHILSPLPSTAGDLSVSAHLWRAAEAGVIESAPSTAVAPGDANAAGCKASPADNMQEVDFTDGNSRSINTDVDTPTSVARYRGDMAIVGLQREAPQDPSTTDADHSNSNLQVLHWGQQVRRRKVLVPKLRTLKEQSRRQSEDAENIRQSQAQCSARIAELEQTLQNAREKASDLAGRYEASKAEVQNVLVTIGDMNDEIEGIDRELLDS
ncbi:hypothetical protein LTR62_001608 [Meristemomyces frigidus]|uniref:Uncharacterized protein n=1 Tax=Meristemomyces frigidus TaxID=1508187 RepID=A0AAN7T978_9PEZI|nr:hypothetical protein LTR62_001608 [Meristemomyces frigidus]